MERRNFITGGIATASGLALAGCLGDEDAVSGSMAGIGGGGQAAAEFPSHGVPAYSAWPPIEPRTNDFAPDANDFVLFGHLNVQLLHQSDDEESEGRDDPASNYDEDVLFLLPGFGFIYTALTFLFGTWGYPWHGELGAELEPEGLETEALTMTEGTLIFHGEYDVGAFADRYADGFEVREHDGFAVFEGQDGTPTEEHAYAVAEDAVVAVIAPEDIGGHDEAVALLDDALANYVEGARRVVDDEDGEWLYDTTGEADMVTGFWGVDDLEGDDIGFDDAGGVDAGEDDPDIGDHPVFANVESCISTLVLPAADGGVGGETTAARFSALYPDGETPSEAELRAGLAASVPDEALDVGLGDDRVHVTAEVSEDELNDE